MDAGVLPLQAPARRLTAADAAFAELDFVAKAENIVFIGPTGVGKTGLAIGLLLKALQNGHRALFVRAQDLFDEMYASLADRSSRKLVNHLARVDVLLIDEMGYLNLQPEQTNIFFKLMEERYRRHPTIITTNLDYDEWHDFLGNKPLVDALLEPAAPPVPHGPHRRPVAPRPRLEQHVSGTWPSPPKAAPILPNRVRSIGRQARLPAPSLPARGFPLLPHRR